MNQAMVRLGRLPSTNRTRVMPLKRRSWSRPKRRLRVRRGTQGKLAAFDWASVETSDYKQYVRNLRAMGFPEGLVRKIAIADVEQSSTRRARSRLNQN